MTVHMESSYEGPGGDKIYEAMFGKWAVSAHIGLGRRAGSSADEKEPMFVIFAPFKDDDLPIHLSLKVALSDLIDEHIELNKNMDRILPFGPSLALRDALLKEAARIEAAVASYNP